MTRGRGFEAGGIYVADDEIFLVLSVDPISDLVTYMWVGSRMNEVVAWPSPWMALVPGNGWFADDYERIA